MAFIAVRQSVHVGVVEEALHTVAPWETLRKEIDTLRKHIQHCTKDPGFLEDLKSLERAS